MEYTRIFQLLTQLSQKPGPSGFEEAAVREAQQLLRPFMDDVQIDRMGNLLGVRRCGRPNAKKVLLDAHLDEIGLITLGSEEGYLRFRTIGGVDPRMLPNTEVSILTEPPLYGVIACLPPHVLETGEADKAVEVKDLWIDTGFAAETVEHMIPVGTPAVFRGGCSKLGDSRVCGKAMDDRACFALLIYVAQLLKDIPLEVDLYILGSTREEVSSAGAITAAYAIAPDCCVAVDVTHGHTPDSSRERTFELGKGPAVGVGPNMTRWMTQRILELAQAAELPYQLEVMEGHTGTNAWDIQIAREGIATAVLSIPLKYMHSPVEMLDLADMQTAAELLCAFVKSFGREEGVSC